MPTRIAVPSKATRKILAALDPVYVAWCAGHPYTQMFDHQGNLLKATKRLVQFTVHTRLPWNCLCMVLCRSQLNQQYIKSIAVNPVQPQTQPMLAPALNTQHQQLLNEVNPQHVLTAGWVASPTGHDIPLEVAAKIMQHQGGWDCLAPWQQQEDLTCST